MRSLILFALLVSTISGAEKHAVAPSSGPKPIGPYSPGISVGKYLYVSGQGARTPDGKMPPDFEAQTRQCLENVKAIVVADGLSLTHLVYSQVYLADSKNMDQFVKIWKEYFPWGGPARSVIGVNRMPTETPVEINAVAVRNLSERKLVHGGVISNERYFLDGVYARDVPSAMKKLEQSLKNAGLGLEHLAFVNIYLDPSISHSDMNAAYSKHFESGNAPARATITVAHLPYGGKVKITGVAVTDLRLRKVVRPRNMAATPNSSPCVWAGETLYCSTRSGNVPGPNGGVWAESIENQVKQTFRNLLDSLEEAGLDFSHVVASNVYLDKLEEFARMNGVYAKYFSQAPPTRTTVEPMPSAERKADVNGNWPRLDEISIVAVR